MCADLQHGALDYADSVGLFQAVLLAGSTPIARVPWNEPGVIGKVLDAGAEAVVVPMVNSAEEAAAVVRAARYPPLGARSFGPTRGRATVEQLRRDRQRRHRRHPDDRDRRRARPPRRHPRRCPASTPSTSVRPTSRSASGCRPGNNDDAASFREALATIVAGCRRHGVVPGIHATGALTARRLEQGFAMVTVTSDAVALRLGLAAEMAIAHRGKDERNASEKPGTYYLTRTGLRPVLYRGPRGRR